VADAGQGAGPIAWFAVHVRSNFERKASRLAARQLGCPVFYPSYSVKSVRRGVEHELVRPLFPGYFFIQRDLVHGPRGDVLGLSGVVAIVSARGKPVPVEPEVMESLMILDGHREEVRPHPFLREGMRVVMRAGPFQGARGHIVRHRGRRPKLVISIQILGRSVGVSVDPGHVEPDL
jgi:transcriptional antiterminator RfaH